MLFSLRCPHDHSEDRMTSKTDAKYKFLFVVTYGRSGSTLLQGVLNSFDGYCIRGENTNPLLKIFRVWRDCRFAREQFGDSAARTADAWFGANFIDPDAFAEDMISAFKRHVLQPPEWARVIGFKEIRYMANFFAPGEFAEYFEFIDQWFPRSAFIFNSRKLSSVSRSGWWKNDPESIAELQATEPLMIAAYRRFKYKSIWLQYEDYANNAEGFRGLAEFLDEPFDLERVNNVLSTRHSFSTSEEKELPVTNEDALSSDRADDYLVPPRELCASFGSTPEEFVAHGEGFTKEYLIRRANLLPHERVLDIGCRFGQNARALVGYLDASGSFEGLEVDQAAVDWCQAAYSHRPNFRFNLAVNLLPGRNDAGDGGTEEFRLPYSDGEFDLVICDGLFLNLQPGEMAKYVVEIARVLKANGRCVVTAFLLNSERGATAASSNCIVSFPFERAGYRISNLDDPTPAIAIQEDLVRNIFSRHGLRICEVVYGFWANTPDLLQALHDCIVMVKQHSPPTKQEG
jgi:SAM-dependent methyltransferase